MMTFEEFFVKKKIDLPALKQADQGLYTEFKNHYVQMGEKSFDHTKKYWFNRLRKTYRLPEEAILPKEKLTDKIAVESTPESAGTSVSKVSGFKPKFKAPVKDESQATEKAPAKTIAEQEIPIDSPVAKPAGFKPRFKPGITKPVEENKEEEVNPSETNSEASETAAKPTGFKPRFKAGVTKPAEENKAEEVNPSEAKIKASETTAKPTGFKPRFKAGATKPAEEIKTDEVNPSETKIETSETTAKPTGFKPRFKAGVTKPAEENKAEEVNPSEAKIEASETAAKPTGFKPRFKAGVTKPAEENKAEEATPKETSNEPSENEDSDPEIKSSNEIKKPIGFKPRFKAGITNKNQDSPEK
ncbi:hypothetical protein [Sphingobacterium hungaricum]